MNDTDHTAIGDSVHRLVKLAMDTGEAESLEEAQKLFMGYRLGVSVGEDAGHSQTLQAAILTIVNSARRSLLGGIEIEGIAGMNLVVPVPPYRSLEESVVGLGGRVVRSLGPEVPLVAVGNAKPTSGRRFAIRVTFEVGPPEFCPWNTTTCGWARATNSRRRVCLRARWRLPRHLCSCAGTSRSQGGAVWDSRSGVPNCLGGRALPRPGHRPAAVRALADRTGEPRSGLSLDTGNAALCGTG